MLSMTIKRGAGILLPVFSLPGGPIGDFGPAAYSWIDICVESGFAYWQILPLQPVGLGNSPYLPSSSFAIDPRYIDIRPFKGKEGAPSEKVDYDRAFAEKDAFLRKYWKRHHISVEKFLEENPRIAEFAYFIVLTKRFDSFDWPSYPKPFRDGRLILSRLDEKELDEFRYQAWLQMVARTQWLAIADYAKKKGVAIIGDIPFYVGAESADVYFNQKMFALSAKTKRPTEVAGVPPDAFSDEGQRWGNALYDWDALKEDGYRFLIERIVATSELTPIIRLDHFRAFDTYWAIPAKSDTAKVGKWKLGPGDAFFEALFKAKPDLCLLAEDLGELREEVYDLRDHWHLPGMNVLQFTFEDTHIRGIENKHPGPRVLYFGTHDNETLASFIDHLSYDRKGHIVSAMAELGFTKGTIADRFIEYIAASDENLVVYLPQDLLGQRDDCRLNNPGTLNDHNWTYRLTELSSIKARMCELRPLLEAYHRA